MAIALSQPSGIVRGSMRRFFLTRFRPSWGTGLSSRNLWTLCCAIMPSLVVATGRTAPGPILPLPLLSSALSVALVGPEAEGRFAGDLPNAVAVPRQPVLAGPLRLSVLAALRNVKVLPLPGLARVLADALPLL